MAKALFGHLVAPVELRVAEENAVLRAKVRRLEQELEELEGTWVPLEYEEAGKKRTPGTLHTKHINMVASVACKTWSSCHRYARTTAAHVQELHRVDKELPTLQCPEQ